MEGFSDYDLGYDPPEDEQELLMVYNNASDSIGLGEFTEDEVMSFVAVANALNFPFSIRVRDSVTERIISNSFAEFNG